MFAGSGLLPRAFCVAAPSADSQPVTLLYDDVTVLPSGDAAVSVEPWRYLRSQCTGPWTDAVNHTGGIDQGFVSATGTSPVYRTEERGTGGVS